MLSLLVFLLGLGFSNSLTCDRNTLVTAPGFMDSTISLVGPENSNCSRTGIRYSFDNNVFYDCKYYDPKTIVVGGDNPLYPLTAEGLQKAIYDSSAKGGGNIELTGDLTISIQILLRSNIHIDLKGHTMRMHPNFTSRIMFSAQHSLFGTSVPVLYDVNMFDNNVYVSDPSQFNVGDVVLLYEGVGSTYILTSIIISMDGNNIILRDGPPNNFYVSKLLYLQKSLGTIKNVSIRNGILDGNNAKENCEQGLWLLYVKGYNNFRLEDVTLQGKYCDYDTGVEGLLIWYGFDLYLENVKTLNIGPNGGLKNYKIEDDINDNWKEMSESHKYGIPNNIKNIRDINIGHTTHLRMNNIVSANCSGFGISFNNVHYSTITNFHASNHNARGMRIDASKFLQFVNVVSNNHRGAAGDGIRSAFGSCDNTYTNVQTIGNNYGGFIIDGNTGAEESGNKVFNLVSIGNKGGNLMWGNLAKYNYMEGIIGDNSYSQNALASALKTNIFISKGHRRSIENVCYNVDVDSNQIRNMYNNPVTIVESPGENLGVFVNEVTISFKPGTVGFTGGGTILLRYSGGSAAWVTSKNQLVQSSFITGGEFRVSHATGIDISEGGGYYGVNIENRGIVLTNLGGTFNNGNGKLILSLCYRRFMFDLN